MKRTNPSGESVLWLKRYTRDPSWRVMCAALRRLELSDWDTESPCYGSSDSEADSDDEELHTKIDTTDSLYQVLDKLFQDPQSRAEWTECLIEEHRISIEYLHDPVWFQKMLVQLANGEITLDGKLSLMKLCLSVPGGHWIESGLGVPWVIPFCAQDHRELDLGTI